MEIMIGGHDYTKCKPPCKIHRIEEVIVHPKYSFIDWKEVESDIMLIRYVSF